MKKLARMKLFTSIFLLLTGCTLEKENTGLVRESIVETIVETTKPLEEIESVETTKKESSIIEETSSYFQRDFDTVLSNDDLILTQEEKGMNSLSKRSEDYFNTLYHCGVQDNRFLQLLDVPFRYQDAYLNEGVTKRVFKHENTYLYNSKEDTIYWERLKEVIKTNTQKLVEQDKKYAYREDNEMLYKGIEELSEEDLEAVLHQLETITMDIKEQYPTYDMAHLACVLENLSFNYHTNTNVFNVDSLASTSDHEISWFLSDDGRYPNLQTAISVNEHEFKHLLCEPCPDETHLKDTFVTPSGITCQDCFLFSYHFIEEATAEELAMERNSKELFTYLECHEILDNLRFVLSLQDDYETDGFLKYGLLQNPIAMVQQFPVLENHSYMFIDNLEMLVGYNVLLNSFPYDFMKEMEELDGYENYYSNPILCEEVYSAMANSSQIQLLKLFLTNLLCLNEHYPETSLEYNFYLMHLFEKRMDIGFDALSSYLGTELNREDYEKSYEMGKQFLFYYFMDITGRSYEDIWTFYQEDVTNISYPTFVRKDIQAFYQQLGRHDYQAQKEKKKTVSDEQYYLK